jgi:hypothetical protein
VEVELPVAVDHPRLDASAGPADRRDARLEVERGHRRPAVREHLAGRTERADRNGDADAQAPRTGSSTLRGVSDCGSRYLGVWLSVLLVGDEHALECGALVLGERT